jgi:phosphoribosylformimino-5-aminoimidazole carboxamide ribotide isomerase
MIAIPAVDLREGACVQLVGGEYSQERIRLQDPVTVARDWTRYGFRRLHVVDLDAATGRGSNRELVTEILRDSSAEVQVGGGVRRATDVEELLTNGASAVVVGTRALEDADWLARLAMAWPNEILVAADVRDRRVVTQGWTRTLARDIIDVTEELSALPLAGLLVTAVHREGRMQGADLFLMEDVVEAASFPVYASGGIGSTGDLRALAERGVAAAVIGMALYTGAIDAWQAAEEFAE